MTLYACADPARRRFLTGARQSGLISARPDTLAPRRRPVRRAGMSLLARRRSLDASRAERSKLADVAGQMPSSAIDRCRPIAVFHHVRFAASQCARVMHNTVGEARSSRGELTYGICNLVVCGQRR